MRAARRMFPLIVKEQILEMLGNFGDQATLDARPADIDRKDVMQRRWRARKRAGHVRVVLHPVIPIDDKVDGARPEFGTLVQVDASLGHVEVAEVLRCDCEKSAVSGEHLAIPWETGTHLHSRDRTGCR